MCELVSIIVPVYNVETFLDRCIDSIIRQTYQKFELLLIDDGSTDRSCDICLDWQGKDNRVKFFRQKNLGVSAARNLGLDHAMGQFITFVDADDFLKPMHLENMLKVQVNIPDGADIVVTNAVDIYEDGKMEISELATKDCILNQDEAIQCFLQGKLFFPVCWGRLYKKACIESVRFDETMRIAEDGKFFLEAIHNSRNIYFLSEPSYFYFIREGSAVHSGFTEKYYDEVKFCEALVERYNGKEKLDIAAKIKFFRFIIRLLNMFDLPMADYSILLAKVRQYYNNVKTELSIKERIKFHVLSITFLRKIYLEVKK